MALTNERYEMTITNNERLALVRSAEVINRLTKVNHLDMKVSQGQLQVIIDYLYCAGYVVSDILKEAN